MRVFLNTNVLVSAFATRGLCADVLRVVLAEHELLTSEGVLAELRRVLGDKFGAPATLIDAAIGLLRRHHVEPEPARPYSMAIADRDDESIVASAVNCAADVFVTGDRELLEAGGVEDLRFLSPRGFWKTLSE